MKQKEIDLLNKAKSKLTDKLSRRLGSRKGWFTAREIGAGQGSPVLFTLKQLCKVGLLETYRRKTWHNFRGSRIYRITDAGVSKLNS